MRELFKRVATDFLNIAAPPLCPACDSLLPGLELPYCGECSASLEAAPWPHELYRELCEKNNRDSVALDAIAALYAFRRGNSVQKLMHALKYRGCEKLGVHLGRELGGALKMFPEFETIDLIVAVPLHKARRRERGYNQAEAVAVGVSHVLQMPTNFTALGRSRPTKSQTQLNATARRENVAGAFAAVAEQVGGRNILICDDVCTTGATLDVCANMLLNAGATRVAGAAVAKDMLMADDEHSELYSDLFHQPPLTSR